MRRISDLDVVRGARRVLVRHWVDLGRLSIRSIKGSLYIRGNLERLAGQQADLTTQNVRNMMHAMHNVRGVKRVYATFDNWTNERGAWVPRDTERSSAELLEGDEEAT